MTRLGMDVDEVERLGKAIQLQADRLQSLSSETDSVVRGLSAIWHGRDAEVFVTDWWPQHRSGLQAVAESVRGLGESALNNATQQRDVSTTDDAGTGAALIGLGGGVAGGIAAAVTPGSGLSAAAPTTTPSRPADTTRPGSPTGELPGSRRSWQDVQQAYDTKIGGYGLFKDANPGGDNAYQCVSWAWFRMKELGYAGGEVVADGGQVAGALGGTATTPPHLGAVMSYGSGFGHVVIAEEVGNQPDGRLFVRVSEMNTGSDGSDAYNASPREYAADRVLVQNPDGTWTSGARNLGRVVVANPGYPTS